MTLAVVVALGIGYFSGSLPWGLWLGRWFRGVDVRTLGSGNLGATNVYRSLGPGLGIATLILDAAKGAVPVWLVPDLAITRAFPGGAEMCALAVGFAAIAGHMWTFLAGFHGGKGVATMAGVLLALSLPAFAAFLTVFVITVAITRYISLGSVLGSIAFAVALAFVSRGGVRSPTFVFGLVVAAAVVWRHRDNLRRLVHGEERRFGLKKSGPARAQRP